MLGEGSHAIEHGTSRGGRWLRARRARIAFWIAALEAVVVAFSADVSKWTVFALALIAVAIYVLAGRDSRSDTLRQGSWIFAASQLLVLCVPIALGILKAIAIGVVAVLAIGALILLFTRRP